MLSKCLESLEKQTVKIKKVVVAGVSQELLTQPLIVVGATTLVITASTASATDVGISFLNIKKSTVD